MGVGALDKAVKLLQEHTQDAQGLTNSNIDTIEDQLRADSSQGHIDPETQSFLKDVRHKIIDGPGYFTTDSMRYFTETYGLTNDQLRGWNTTWLNSFADDISGPIDNYQSYDTRKDLIHTAVEMASGETSTTLVSELTDIILDQDPVLSGTALRALCELYSDTDGRYGQIAIGQQLLNHSDAEVRRTVLQVLSQESHLTGISTSDLMNAFNNPDNGPVMQYHLAQIAIGSGHATKEACEVLAAIANGTAFPDAYYAKAKEKGPEAKEKLQADALKLLQTAPRDSLEAVLPQIEILLRSEDRDVSLATIETISENFSETGFNFLFNLIYDASRPQEIQVAAFHGLNSMLKDLHYSDGVDLGVNGPVQEIRDLLKSNLSSSNLDVQLTCIEGLSTVDQIFGWQGPEQVTREAMHAALNSEFQTLTDYKHILTTIENIYPTSGDFKSYLVDSLDYKLNSAPNSDWEIATLKAMPVASDNPKIAKSMLAFAQNSPNLASVKVALVCLKDVLDSSTPAAKKQLAPAIGQFAKMVLDGNLPCLDGATEQQMTSVAELAKRLLS